MIGRIRKITIVLMIAALLVGLAGVMDAGGGSVFAASGKKFKKPPKPSIKSVTSSQKAMTIKTKRYKKIRGFQIKYSRSKSFSSAKVITVKGKQLNKTIKLLRSGKRYYVRIRTYKKKRGRMVYSKWSKWKSVTIPKTNFKGYTVYVKSNWVYLHKSMNRKSGYVRAWYNAKMYLKDQYRYSDGTWNQVRYSGKTYFIWVSKGSKTISSKKNSLKYKTHNKYEKKVVAKALEVYKQPTKYDYTHNAVKGVMASDGKYPFDCSNFTAYVLNSAMQEYCPAFRLSSDDDEQYRMENIVNDGLEGEVNCKIVCRGKPNLDMLRPGDLLFFGKNHSSIDPVRHVGMYLGHGEFIHSDKPYSRYPGDHAGGVYIQKLRGDYADSFVLAKRVIPEGFTELDIPMKTAKRSAVYSEPSCWVEDKIEYIPKNTNVNVMYTVKRRNAYGTSPVYTKVAYVRYTDKYALLHYAFVLYENLTDADPPVEPDIPEEPDDPVLPDIPADPSEPDPDAPDTGGTTQSAGRRGASAYKDYVSDEMISPTDVDDTAPEVETETDIDTDIDTDAEDEALCDICDSAEDETAGAQTAEEYNSEEQPVLESEADPKETAVQDLPENTEP